MELDWLSAARVHPVNDIANKSLQAMIIVALGYAPVLLAGALPLFTAYAIFLHANVSWNFGALRFVLASPRFHRWHHAAAEEGREKTSPGSCRYRIFFSAPTTCRRNSRLGSACRIRTQRIYSVKFSGRSEIQQGRKFSTDLDGENFAQSYAETPKSGG